MAVVGFYLFAVCYARTLDTSWLSAIKMGSMAFGVFFGFVILIGFGLVLVTEDKDHKTHNKR